LTLEFPARIRRTVRPCPNANCGLDAVSFASKCRYPERSPTLVVDDREHRAFAVPDGLSLNVASSREEPPVRGESSHRARS
jgi:hypothetical protein